MRLANAFFVLIDHTNGTATLSAKNNGGTQVYMSAWNDDGVPTALWLNTWFRNNGDGTATMFHTSDATFEMIWADEEAGRLNWFSSLEALILRGNFDPIPGTRDENLRWAA